MKRKVSLILAAVIMISALSSCNGGGNDDPTVTEAITVEEITAEGENRIMNIFVNDSFWEPIRKQNICTTVKHCLEKMEQRGSFQNIINAANKNAGREYEQKFVSASFEDFEVFKTVEAMIYCVNYDAKGDEEIIAAQKFYREKLDYYIPYLVEAVEDDGYISSYFTLFGAKWTGIHNHELFNCGQYYEMAMALYETSGGTDTRLLDCAVRNADYLCSFFGEGKWNAVPGHQEIEQSLIRLAILCKSIGGKYAENADSYAALSRYFLENRGNYSKRKMPWQKLVDESFKGEYNQDFAAASKQTEAFGHCVRATLMYTGMAYNEEWYGDGLYTDALSALWDDVQKKSYPTGGVGSDPHNEGFSSVLDQSSAYCETCASVGLMRWSSEMSKLYGDSKYMDEFEKVLYNAFLSGVGIDGKSFYYVNPVKNEGNIKRLDWYECSCCPPNIITYLMLIQNHIYNVTENDVQINLYIGNDSDIAINGKQVVFSMESSVVSDGKCKITVSGINNERFALRLRRPAWATKAEITVNGVPYEALNDKGYLVVYRNFKNGDVIEVDFGNELQVVECTDAANIGYAYIEKGPFVYAAELIDAAGKYKVSDISIGNTPLTYTVTTKNRLITSLPQGGRNSVDLLAVDGFNTSSKSSVSVKLIPYYACANRLSTVMTVYYKLDK